jgi:hypothetical protein
MSTKTKRLERTYSAHEEQAGLEALAFYNGNGRAAAKLLKKQGMTIHSRTLYRWRHEKADRYAEVCATRTPQMLAQVAANLESALADQIDLEHKLTLKALDEIDGLDPKDTSTALRNAGVTKGINVDKILEIRGAPQRPIENPSLDELKQRMIRKGYAIEGEATEVESESELVQSDT